MWCWDVAWVWRSPAWDRPSRLTRAVLDGIGGFAAFADYLADDYEIGQAVRARGYAIAIPALGVGHTATEGSARELFRHELRWTRTIRTRQSRWAIWAASLLLRCRLALMAAILLDFSAAVPGGAGDWRLARGCF